MEKKPKCKYCGAILSSTNSVFIEIIRYDDRPDIMVKKKLLCTGCWDNASITINGRKEHD